MKKKKNTHFYNGVFGSIFVYWNSLFKVINHTQKFKKKIESKCWYHSGLILISLFYTITSVLQYLYRHRIWEESFPVLLKQREFGEKKKTFPTFNFNNSSESRLSSELFL
jgi:hypothetical protein